MNLHKTICLSLVLLSLLWFMGCGNESPKKTAEKIVKIGVIYPFSGHSASSGKDLKAGMGLAVVHGIVKSHGGDILVRSKPGKGTTFHVLFPCIREAPEPKIEITAEIPRGSENILVVDDERAIADVTQSMIERLG